MDDDFKTYKIDPELIIDALSKTDLFSHLSLKVLDELILHMETIFIPGQTVIIEEGELGEDLFIVMHGLLSVYTEEKGAIAVIGSGGVVGEVGLLVEAERIASVKTIRDSILLRLKKSVFDSYTSDHPVVCLNIARQCISRLVKGESFEKGEVKTIALVPISKSPVIQDFIRHVYMMLYREGTTLLVNSEMVTGKFRNLKSPNLISWLNDQEYSHKFIIYEADDDNSEWTQLCLRQADMVFFICDDRDNKHLREVEKHSLSSTHNGLFILHEDRSIAPLRTKEWLKEREVDEFHHIVPTDARDIDKVSRIIRGKARGLVLSGGGARGAAHIGLIKAIEELNLPIDMIGATSSGAIFGALYCTGYDSQMLRERYEEIMVKGSILDYTFPYTALSRGHILERHLIEYSGEERLIEDLWMKFFCISTNVTKSREEVHKEGLIWRALRASVSLPGIYPPVLGDNGLLIDGGSINNLPVEVMRRQFFAGNIIASLVSTVGDEIEMNVEGYSLSGWKILLNKLNPFIKRKIIVPRIDTVIVAGMSVNDCEHQLIQAALADQTIYLHLDEFGFGDYKLYDKIIEEGYKQAIRQLGEMS